MDPDALLHPVGPLPPRVYWLRRTVAVGFVVLVLLLAVTALVGGGHPSSRPVAGRSTSQTPSPVGSDSPSSAPPATPAGGASSSPTPTIPPICADSALSVTAGTDAASYGVGVLPVLSIRVRNVGPVACRRDVGPGARSLTVLSGSDRIWSSNDCERRGSAVVTLRPGGTWSHSARWTRARSRPGCPAATSPALPGTYRLYAALGAVTSAPAVFALA